MAAIYAPPVTMLSTDGHGHGHGHSHSHGHNYGHGHRHGHGNSHSQKPITQRIPLQPTSINGGPPLHGGQTQLNPLKPHTHSYSVPSRPQVDSSIIQQEQPESNLPPPSINSSLNQSNGRPKGMERRRSSVGLPTHLRLGSTGYGFPPAKNQKYVPINDGTKRKWITVSEAVSAVIVPLPYVLVSFAYGPQNIYQHMPQHSIAGQLRKILLEKISNGNIMLSAGDGSLFSACALTSATLLLAGVKGKLSGPPAVRDRRKNSTGKSNQPASVGIRRVVERTLGVGLPFYATMKLGADRVALVMLVALAADITNTEDETTDLKSFKSWKRMIIYRQWTLASITFQILCDIVGLTSHSLAWELCIGYVALTLSILLLPPPFPSLKSKNSPTSSFSVAPASPASRVLAAQWESRTQAKPNIAPHLAVSPLLSTSRDIDLTLVAGIAVGALTCTMFFFSTVRAGALSLIDVGFGFLSASAAAISFQFVQPHTLRQNSGLGMILGSVMFWLIMAVFRSDTWSRVLYQGVFISISFTAIKLDTLLSVSNSSHSDRQTLHQNQHSSQQAQPSRFSEMLLRSCQHWPLLHSILAEKDSRRIFYFMSLNFAFMLVQTFYGIASGSLGLLSDSIHMFFDCLALVVGLCAAVMSKWPPSARFPYGYGKMDTLAGFANGIFLMLISIEIVYEAIERLAEGTEMQRIGELLTVSTLGLAVNLVGITAFGHAHHGHSHEGHDHSDHSHESHEPTTSHSHEAGHHHHHNSHNHAHLHDHLHDHLHAPPAPLPYTSTPTTPLKPSHTHSHSHSHKHHHGNENMHGIFLHILADTLGSVAVVISTILIHFYGWAGFDPLASCLIAILIFASAIPLVASSARTLLLTVPESTEFDLREALAGISGLRGVVGYAVPKFWLEEGEGKRVLGVIHVVAAKGADMEDVKERAIGFLRGRNMEVVVQVERDGSDRCWCRTGTKV